ncbi:MAG: ribbon-helix-helix protein, CopG family [Alkalispirochaeta sp.]
MKAVQVLFDEELLERLSENLEVKRDGRSEFVRRAVRTYLAQRERERISEGYRKAYAKTSDLDRELEEWSEEGRWPTE